MSGERWLTLKRVHFEGQHFVPMSHISGVSSTVDGGAMVCLTTSREPIFVEHRAGEVAAAVVCIEDGRCPRCLVACAAASLSLQDERLRRRVLWENAVRHLSGWRAGYVRPHSINGRRAEVGAPCIFEDWLWDIPAAAPFVTDDWINALSRYYVEGS